MKRLFGAAAILGLITGSLLIAGCEPEVVTGGIIVIQNNTEDMILGAVVSEAFYLEHKEQIDSEVPEMIVQAGLAATKNEEFTEGSWKAIKKHESKSWSFSLDGDYHYIVVKATYWDEEPKGGTVKNLAEGESRSIEFNPPPAITESMSTQ
jgi:hypothetical protein